MGRFIFSLKSELGGGLRGIVVEEVNKRERTKQRQKLEGRESYFGETPITEKTVTR